MLKCFNQQSHEGEEWEQEAEASGVIMKCCQGPRPIRAKSGSSPGLAAPGGLPVSDAEWVPGSL